MGISFHAFGITIRMDGMIPINLGFIGTASEHFLQLIGNLGIWLGSNPSEATCYTLQDLPECWKTKGFRRWRFSWMVPNVAFHRNKSEHLGAC